MRRYLTVLGVLSVVSLVSGRVARAADDEQAKQYFLEGKQAYQEGRYHAAVASFRAAAAIRPSPILDFNTGRCFEKLGKLGEAIVAYRKYLATAKDAANREEVRQKVEKLEAERRRQRAKDPYEDIEEDSTAPAAGAPTPPPTPPAPAAAASRPTASPSSPPAASRPNPIGAAEPAHEATLPRSWEGPGTGAGLTTGRSPTPASPRKPGAPAPRTADGPAYKQWWFWVACAAGAAVAGLIITTAVYAGGGGSSGRPAASALQVRF